MPFRKRAPQPELSLEDAKTEVERARGALQYWKRQQSEALEDLVSMQGVGGWIARLTGQHADNVAEAEQKVKICQAKLTAEGAALKKAQADVAALTSKQGAEKAAADEHLLDLELVAERLRSSDHPDASRLTELEDQLDQVGKALIAQQEVVVAAGALVASLGALNRSAIKAQSRILGMITAPLESKAAYDAIPGALVRFHDACIEAEIPPLDIRIPGLDMQRLLSDPVFVATRDPSAAVEDLRQAILDERDSITDIQLQVATFRKRTLAEQSALHAKRTALLETHA